MLNLDFPIGFYPAAAVAILLTGIIKGGFGGAAGGLAVPIMAIWVSPAVAAGVMLPILCAMDIFGTKAYWGRWSLSLIRPVLIGALVGIVLGALLFQSLSVQELRLIIGSIAVVFVLNNWFQVAARIAAWLQRAPGQMGVRAGYFWGVVSGVTSTLAHAGGPPFAVYVMTLKPDKTVLVASASLYFLVVNYAKLVPYYFLGQLNVSNLGAALLFAPLAPLGIWLGVWLHKRVSERMFYQVSYLLLFCTGLKLIWDGLAG
ncbi:MAG: sulfite exporter TauE/SafE family protein [Burkholderiaceae bacterium]|jgi:uncharacterized membrane protein YfcA